MKTQYCEWFLLCTNEATTTRRMPVLGDVPVCQQCADRADSIERQTINHG